MFALGGGQLHEDTSDPVSQVISVAQLGGVGIGDVDSGVMISRLSEILALIMPLAAGSFQRSKRHPVPAGPAPRDGVRCCRIGSTGPVPGP